MSGPSTTADVIADVLHDTLHVPRPVARSTAQHWRRGRRPRLDHLLTIAASIDGGSADG